ncbi:MAG: substrate-binding domain-containing protein [Verrucomicrobiales bacterium]|nr:substrate-binding domain-containing protein [Verrucomicrobiales bacterium]
MARSYDELWVARPFRNDPATDALIASVMEVAEKAGTGSLSCQIKEAATPADRAALVREAAEAECRIGVFCPEDNVTQFLYEELTAQEVPCPSKIGLLSGMGTDVLDDEISTLFYDFREMGARAAEMLDSGKSEQIKVRPDLRASSST